MFLSYYGLDKNVFSKELNVKEAYRSEDYVNMINRLEYLKEIKGIGIFIGNPGVGKTYTTRCFKSSVNEDLYKIIYISATKLTVFEFLNVICKELGLDVGSCYRNEIETKIQTEIKNLKARENKDVIVIIDNAENLSSEILLEIKILYDFDMDSMDYISVIIIGNEDILTELRKTKYETLKQRIVIKYKFQGLKIEETDEYIKTRLELSGQEYDVFSKNAKYALYRVTNGNIRKLNMMIQNCLIIGMQQNKKVIDEEIVRLAKEETEI